MADVSIRRAEEGDLPALLDVYNYYVRETPITFDLEPRTLAQRREWFNGFAPTGRYQCFVAVKDGLAIGWASSHRFKERAAYDTTVESSVYLAPNETGRRIGRQLYETLFDALEGQDIHRIHGGVTQPNPASNRLHEALGFRRVGVLPEVGRKFGRFWDVATYIRFVSAQP
ncbi:MAG TPA: GNAT family N-acetyltransferase [Rhizomicrobium sp.]|jgi:phosphinothricin acetyltransferase